MPSRCFWVAVLLFSQIVPAAETPLAFPGAVGAAATTPGGRGGEILRVTTLAASGPGSFVEAVKKAGPRIIVFEVGGVIDLAESTVRITEPYLTIAGQTAPAPGITFIRGGIDIATHDVVIRHIRVRPGDGGRPKLSGDDYDAISTIGAHDVIVDHCTLTWATDENLSASGPRFTGNTPEEWRKGTSHRITFSNNIIAEGLADSVHIKGEHSKGSLIHDNTSDILIIGNLYAHDRERSPLFKGGARGAIVNNLIYDPGPARDPLQPDRGGVGRSSVPDRRDGRDRQRAAGRAVDTRQDRAGDGRRFGRPGAVTNATTSRWTRIGQSAAAARLVHERADQDPEACRADDFRRDAAAGARRAGLRDQERRRVQHQPRP